MSNQIIGEAKLIIGLGHIGLPIFCKYFNEEGIVYGIDRDAELIERLKGANFSYPEPGVDITCEMRGFFDVELPPIAGPVHVQVCINAEIQEGNYEFAGVRNLIEEILDKYAECCVTIRTTLGVEDLMYLESELKVGEKQGVCFCPEFLREGLALKDLSNNPVYIGPIVTGSAFQTEHYFQSDIFECFKTLALLKVTNNAWRATKVSFANKLMLLADGLGIEASDLHRLFIADDLNVNKSYLKPGEPFGGYCLPKEARKFVEYEKKFSKSSIVKSAIEINQETISFWANKIFQTGRKNIVFEFLSFKKGLKDYRNSQWVFVEDELVELGCKVFDWSEIGLDCLSLEQPVFVSISDEVPDMINEDKFLIMRI